MDLNDPWIRPLTLEGHIVRLTPLPREHAKALYGHEDRALRPDGVRPSRVSRGSGEDRSEGRGNVTRSHGAPGRVSKAQHILQRDR